MLTLKKLISKTLAFTMALPLWPSTTLFLQFTKCDRQSAITGESSNQQGNAVVCDVQSRRTICRSGGTYSPGNAAEPTIMPKFHKIELGYKQVFDQVFDKTANKSADFFQVRYYQIRDNFADFLLQSQQTCRHKSSTSATSPRTFMAESRCEQDRSNGI